MGFERLTPPGSSEKLSFGSSACSGPGPTWFNPRGKSSLMPVRRSLPKGRLRGGKRQRRVCSEGPVEGPGQEEFIFKLVGLTCRHTMRLRICLCWLCTPRRALGDSEAAIAAPGSSLESVWEEESNSLVYLGHWMVSWLSAAAAGCEQSQLQLLADGFCRSQCSSPAGIAQPGQASCANVEGSGGSWLNSYMCSVIKDLVFQSLLWEFSLW